MIGGFSVFIVCVSNVAAVALNIAGIGLARSVNDTSDLYEGIRSTSVKAYAGTFWPLESPNPISAYPSPNSLTSNSSELDAPRVPNFSCNGAAYGRNLKLRSCVAAIEIMSNEPSIVTFGQRGKGTWDANLPFRWLSRDGQCAIDLGHTQEFESDAIKAIDLQEIAKALLNICVVERGRLPNEGGLVTNIGENGNLLLRMVKYKPSVTCGPDNSGPPWPTCRYVVDNMPTGGRKETFGPRDDRETTVPLPWGVTAGPRICKVVVDGTEAGAVKDTGTWYTMWLAANAVDYMSVMITREQLSLLTMSVGAYTKEEGALLLNLVSQFARSSVDTSQATYLEIGLLTNSNPIGNGKKLNLQIRRYQEPETVAIARRSIQEDQGNNSS